MKRADNYMYLAADRRSAAMIWLAGGIEVSARLSPVLRVDRSVALMAP